MKSRNLSNHAAIVAVGLYALASLSACDAPTAEESRAEPTDLIADALVPATPDNSYEAVLADAAAGDPNTLYIEEIKTNGKGCPKGDPDSVATLISDDKKSFVILYQDMELEYPPGPKVKNLSCQAAIKLHIPGGYQVALASVNTRGYLYLDKYIKARETSGYFFAGVPVGAYPHTTIVGPYDDFYEFNDTIPFASWVWSPCGSSAIFGINTTLNLNAKANPKGQAIFSTNTTDGVFKTILHWQIKKC